MNRVEAILSAALLVSLVFNAGILAYARTVVRRLLFVSEELGDLQNMIDSFAKHTKSVYELDMFYGDATLEHLMNHAISFNEQLETFEFIYSLTEQKEIKENEDEELLNDTEEEAPAGEN